MPKIYWNEIRYDNGLLRFAGTGYDKDGRFFAQGKGTLYNDDGMIIYEGFWVNDQWNGEGKWYYDTGSVYYEGPFMDGKPNGWGKVFYETGELKYEGDLIDDIWEGTGTKYREDGTIIYSGGYVNNNASGEGKFFYESGALMYEGGVVDGVWSGTGTKYREDGSVIYSGGYANNKVHGEGKFFYENGALMYEGGIVDGVWSGTGTKYREDGTVIYSGGYANNQPHGKGRYYYASGALWYEGDCVEGKWHGMGRLYGKDGGLAYEGKFVHGKRADELTGEDTSEDTSGDAPPEADVSRSESTLERLQSLIGLESVKREVNRVIQLHNINAKKRALGIKTPSVSMHMVFTGNPGTGKTTVANMIGEIYHEIGLLPNSQVLVVKREDLVGEYIGHTAPKTKEVIQKALGGILFIDEAYTLSPKEKGNDFGQEAIDTLLACMEENRDNLAVIVAGYDSEIQRFIGSNPGLKSRFKTFIHFEDYSAPQLHQIFCQMVHSDGYQVEEAADPILVRYFDRLYRTRGSSFGNGRDVRNFYESVLMHNASRLSEMDTDSLTTKDYVTLTQSDIQATIDAQLGRPPEDKAPVLERLNAMTGLSRVKEEVCALRQLALYQQRCHELNLPANPPSMHMVFTGNPGTGKTTVANMIGEIYHEIGLLPTSRVLVVKREDLVAGYIGQTAIKTKEAIQRALGGVLFIDEAYTLSHQESGQDFGQEAIDTLLACMEENRENLAVIVAGYSSEMQRFIDSNPGLKSRFTKYIHFDDYNGGELAQIFRGFARNYTFGEGAEEELRRVCEEMYQQRDQHFGNARDVRNLFSEVTASLAARVCGIAQPTGEDLTRISREDILEAERKRSRNQSIPKPKGPNPIGFDF